MPTNNSDDQIDDYHAPESPLVSNDLKLPLLRLE